MSTLTCDHCGEYSCDETIDIPTIMWCLPCIDKDYKMLESVGRTPNSSFGKHFIWYNPNSIREIGALPKKWKAQPLITFKEIDHKLGAPFVSDTIPCSRAYYGLPDCTCGRCPPKRHVVNTNPFRYGE